MGRGWNTYWLRPAPEPLLIWSSFCSPHTPGRKEENEGNPSPLSIPAGAGKTIKWPSYGEQGRTPGALLGTDARRGPGSQHRGQRPHHGSPYPRRPRGPAGLIFVERADEPETQGKAGGGSVLNLFLPEPRSGFTPCPLTGDPPGGGWPTPLLCPGGASLGFAFWPGLDHRVHSVFATRPSEALLGELLGGHTGAEAVDELRQASPGAFSVQPCARW